MSNVITKDHPFLKVSERNIPCVGSKKTPDLFSLQVYCDKNNKVLRPVRYFFTEDDRIVLHMIDDSEDCEVNTIYNAVAAHDTKGEEMLLFTGDCFFTAPRNYILEEN